MATDAIVQYLAQHRPTIVAHEVVSESGNMVVTQSLESMPHTLTNGYVALCIAGSVAVFLTAYTLTRYLMVDKFQHSSKKLWVAYLLAMSWLAIIVAVYYWTSFDTMWLGWVMLVAPLMMTLVCPKYNTSLTTQSLD